MIRLHGEMIRGGTSKCWIFDRDDTRATGHPDEEVLLAAFNAEDARQADGIGGASSTTSKAALVSASIADGADVDYTFAQVGVGERSVEWSSNCGNCATAVALWAAHRGHGTEAEGSVVVRLRNTNTGALLHAVVPLRDGRVPEEGSAVVPGVAGTGVPVELGFVDPAGSTTGRLLPTGRVVDVLRLVDGPWAGDHAATLVDAGAPAALLEASSFGLAGDAELLTVRSVVPELTALRRTAGVAMGLLDMVGPIGHAVPKVGLVAAPVDYRTTAGDHVPADAYDLAVRMISMHAPHPAIGLTSAVAVAAAALTDGTVAHRLLSSPATDRLRLGTPGGVVPVGISRAADGSITRVTLRRAARRLTESTVLVPLPALSTSPPTSATLVGAGPEGRIA